MPRNNKKHEEKTYDIPDIDARLVAMKCEHIYTHGHSAGCDKCHYIPYEEDDVSSFGAKHHNQPVDNTNHTADVYNNPMLIDGDFNEYIENMRLQNVINKTTYEQLKKRTTPPSVRHGKTMTGTPSVLRREKILVELKERYTKGKLSEKKYAQMVIATHMQY